MFSACLGFTLSREKQEKATWMEITDALVQPQKLKQNRLLYRPVLRMPWNPKEGFFFEFLEGWGNPADSYLALSILSLRHPQSLCIRLPGPW